MRGILRTTFVTAAVAVALTGCADQDDPDDAVGDDPAVTTGSDDDRGGAHDRDGTEVALVDATGAQIGTAWVEDDDGGVGIEVEVADLSPGFHGFHLHAVGLCEPDSPDPTDPAKVGDFLSAGGHVGGDAADHGAHAGDLPSLLVDDAGAGTLTVRTATVTLDDLLDDDGTALVLHVDPDNFAHVPERYAPAGPDEQTLRTGDAGDRVACGVLGE